MTAKAGLWAPILSLFGPNSRNIRPNYLLIQRLSRAQHRSNEVVLVFGAKCRSRLDLRGGGTKKAPKHYQNPSIKLRSRPKSAFLRSCTGKPRSFAPKTRTRETVR